MRVPFWEPRAAGHVVRVPRTRFAGPAEFDSF